MVNRKNLKIYCDGACSGNPGNAGSGLAIYEGKDFPTLIYGDYEELGTNNTAELNALYKALDVASNVNCENIIEICSDSKYSIECITNWAYGWKAKGWKKKGGEIKNLALIQKAHALYEELKDKINILHVKGHAGVEGNELADRMAVYTIISKSVEYQKYTYENIDEVLDLKRG
jgi:ribonuclease HI